MSRFLLTSVQKYKPFSLHPAHVAACFANGENRFEGMIISRA